MPKKYSVREINNIPVTLKIGFVAVFRDNTIVFRHTNELRDFAFSIFNWP